ncbi:MAG: ATP-binding cassette domain-containing protein, partial [Acidimicrobiia bacterium]
TASHLTKSYSQCAGVFDIDLEVTRGQIVGLIGPSGSGKTTSVHLMTGLLTPESGKVHELGQNPTRVAPPTRARIGYMAQDSVFFPESDPSREPRLRRVPARHALSAASGDRRDGLLVTTQYVGEAAYCNFVGVLASEGCSPSTHRIACVAGPSPATCSMPLSSTLPAVSS